MDSIEEFKSDLLSLLNRNGLLFYWKARVGLYALLKSLGIKEGDEVILPAYTCVVVPNAILYLGAKPIYVDIDTHSYNMSFERLKSAITERTKVIVCQNTYGLSSNLIEITALAKERGIFTIEDCTHGFGGTYEGVPNGLTCDAAIYSTQWNKPFSTGIGGFVVVQIDEVSKKLQQLNLDLIEPSFKEKQILRVLYFVKRYLLNEYTYWPLLKLYRLLSKLGIVVGSSSGGEISSIKMPDGYFKAFSEVQAKEGLKNLPKLAADLVTRKESGHIYTEFLKENTKTYVDERIHENHSFLKYPILVKNRDAFFEAAFKSKIELGDWFTSPLHPVEGDLSDWYFVRTDYPNAEYASQHVVNLPTTPKNIGKVLAFLQRELEQII